MAVKYQIDGNIFREITTSWFCAFVNESLIKARQVNADQSGNAIEYFQLNDGRVFSRLAPSLQTVVISKDANTRLRNVRPAMEQSLTQPR